MEYERYTGMFKALSDENRLKIIDILSCGELCGCEILKHFDFTQSALSQHMKVLILSGLVIGNRQGAWMHYSLNQTLFEEMKEFIKLLCENNETCVCKKELEQ